MTLLGFFSGLCTAILCGLKLGWWLISAVLQASPQSLLKPVTFQPFQSLNAPLFRVKALILSALLLVTVLLKSFQTS